MANVLDEDKKDQVIALGRLGWSLRRIEQATSVRRETASAYLKAAGLQVRGRGRPGRPDSKPASSRVVSTDPGTSKPATTPEVSTDSDSKPAITEGCPPALCWGNGLRRLAGLRVRVRASRFAS